MTTPESRKLYDIHDVALALGQGTPTGDVSGELVDVGAGRAEDFEGKELTGKVVLSSERPRRLRARRSRRAPSASSATPRCGPTIIPIRSRDTRFAPPAGATAPTFGWAVEPRVGRDLALRSGAARRSPSARS